MRLATVTICAGVGLLCGAAQAEENWYASAKLGFNTLGDQTVSYAGPGGSSSGNAEFDGGFAAGGAVGYKFGNNWRLEGEVLYRTSELDTADISGLGTFTEGDYSSVAIAVNGLYDFDLFGNEKIKTYVGGGIGWLQEIDIDFEQNGVEQSFSTDDIGFQAMFGARYELGENWFIDAEARYFYASDVEMTAEDNAIGRVTADYDPLTLAVSVGLVF